MPKSLPILFALLQLTTVAQVPPALDWQACYGGSGYEGAGIATSALDGGLIMVSLTQSNDGQVIGYHGDTDIWVVKLDEGGSLQWQRCLGGFAYDSPAGVHAMSDGGFVVVGTVSSSDGDVTGNHGSSDAWAVKLTAQGDIDWQRCYGGSGAETAMASEQAANGNIIFIGSSSNPNGDVTSNAGSADLWAVEINGNGEIVWQRSYGGPGEDTGWALALDGAGGLLALGIVSLDGGLVQGVHGANDIWAIRISATGDMVWQRCLGGSAYDWGFNGTRATNGDWLICGMTESSDGDVEGHHAQYDAWLIRLHDDGEIAWQRPLGGAGSESFGVVSEFADGSLLLCGGTDSSDGDVISPPLQADAWLLNLSADGSTINWQALYGGSLNESYAHVQGEALLGLVVSGSTTSNDGDVNGNHGEQDAWLVRLTPLSALAESDGTEHVHVFPNPFTATLGLTLPSSWRGTVQYTLFDDEGRMSANGTVGASGVPIINLSALPPASYSLVLQCGNQLAYGQVVKAP